ncbi:MAG: amidohydrolase, partial [Myxococcales bacterium]|nr:amidohydrolase [Myxococcales bacterium]
MVTCAYSGQAKKVFINAQIYDGENFLSEDSFIVENERFTKIAKRKEIEKNISKNDEIIDLNNARVLPGFIESHAHLLGIGRSILELDIRNMNPKQVAQALAKQARKQKPGTWIRGRGWDHNLWPEKQFPHAHMLKGVADKNPVYLRRVDGHAGWMNDYAMKVIGLDKNTLSPDGGLIIKDKNGLPTGVLVDNALSIVNKFAEIFSDEEIAQFFDKAVRHVLSFGITSFHDAGIDKKSLSVLLKKAQQNQLELRIYTMLDGEDEKFVEEYLKKGPQKINDYLSIRAIKYFADGALGSRGALLLKDYSDQADYQGLALISEKELHDKTLAALKKGFQVATHAIGDQANRVVLNAYEKALAQHPSFDARLRIEHAQLIDPMDHHRFKKLGVIASMQPSHCTSDMEWVADRLGFDRLAQRAYPWRSLIEKGAPLAFGSDAPVESVNPIEGLFAAVTRSKQPHSISFYPDQQLTLKEALNGYHSGAAFAEFSEHQKGKIARGFLADFVVYKEDILHPSKNEFLD